MCIRDRSSSNRSISHKYPKLKCTLWCTLSSFFIPHPYTLGNSYYHSIFGKSYLGRRVIENWASIDAIIIKKMLWQSFTQRQAISEASLTTCVIFWDACLAWKVAIKVKVEIFISKVKTKTICSIRVDLKITSLNFCIGICQVLYRKINQLRLELT